MRKYGLNILILLVMLVTLLSACQTPAPTQARRQTRAAPAKHKLCQDGRAKGWKSQRPQNRLAPVSKYKESR